MEVDAALTSLGKYGKWQLVQLFSISIFTAGFHVFIALGIVFQGWTPPYHCNVAQNTTRNGSWSNDTKYGESPTDQCHISPNDTATCPDGFTFESDGYFTIIEQFNWICDLEFMNAMTQSVYYFGVVVGSLIIPSFGDYFGRKYAVIIPAILAGVFHLLAAIIVHPIVFIVFRFLSGAFVQGAYLVGFVLACEIFPSDMRSVANSSQLILWSLGLLLTGMFGYFITSWRTFQIIGAVLTMGIFVGIWAFDESIPWLVANSRGSEALAILQKAVKMNRCQVNDDVMFSFKTAAGLSNDPDECKTQGTETQNYHVASGKIRAVFKYIFTNRNVNHDAVRLLDVLKHRKLRLYVVLECFIWCFNGIMYYGLTLSTSVMPGGRFVNYFLGAAAELPAYIVVHFLLVRLGRRITLVGLFIMSSVAITSSALCPAVSGGVDLVPMLIFLNVLGKFCSSATYAGILIHTCELYPTNFRNRGVGIACVFAHIGSMVASYVEYLAHVLPWIPGVLLGSIGFLAAALVLPLPETKGKPIPQTLDDVPVSRISRSPGHASDDNLISTAAVQS